MKDHLEVPVVYEWLNLTVQRYKRCLLITGNTIGNLSLLRSIKKQTNTGQYNPFLRGWVFALRYAELVTERLAQEEAAAQLAASVSANQGQAPLPEREYTLGEYWESIAGQSDTIAICAVADSGVLTFSQCYLNDPEQAGWRTLQVFFNGAVSQVDTPKFSAHLTFLCPEREGLIQDLGLIWDECGARMWASEVDYAPVGDKLLFGDEHAIKADEIVDRLGIETLICPF